MQNNHTYSPYRVYKVYGALSLHFGSDFNFFKYGCNLKQFTPEAFESKRYVFEKLYNRFKDEQDLLAFLAPVFFYHKPSYPGDLRDLLTNPSEDIVRFSKYQAAPAYQALSEFKAVLQKQQIKQLFSDPLLLMGLTENRAISAECVIIIDRATGVLSAAKSSTNFLASRFAGRLNKLAGFLKSSEEDHKQIRQGVRKCIEQTLIV